MACIPFKFNYWLQANEYYYCTCKKRTFHVTFLKRNQTYSLSFTYSLEPITVFIAGFV